MEVKYPNIKVQLSGEDGDAFAIMGTVSKALRKNKISEDLIVEFKAEAMSGDYDHLLQTCMRWVTVG